MKILFRAFFVAAVLVAPSVAAAQVPARFAAVQGAVVVERGGAQLRAQVGGALEIGDVVRTGETGRAKLLLEDGSVINVGDDSRLKLTKLVIDASGGREGVFELVRGRVRAWVTKLRQQKNTFEIQTPTAVAGVRGTDYALRESNEGAQVVVFGGEVVVRSSVEGIAGQCVAQGGMACEVARGQAPGGASPASFELQQVIINETRVSSVFGKDGTRFASLLGARLRQTPGLGEWRPLGREGARSGERHGWRDSMRLPGDVPILRDTILPTSLLDLRVQARVGSRF